MMVKGHKKAVDLYEDAADQVEDQDVLDYVNKTLPVIKMHLDSAQAIQADLGGNNDNM
jgi:putative membrane protein